MFKDWTNEKGGFVIKWINDESALVVFADPTVGELVFVSLLPACHILGKSLLERGMGSVSRVMRHLELL